MSPAPPCVYCRNCGLGADLITTPEEWATGVCSGYGFMTYGHARAEWPEHHIERQRQWIREARTPIWRTPIYTEGTVLRCTRCGYRPPETEAA